MNKLWKRGLTVLAAGAMSVSVAACGNTSANSGKENLVICTWGGALEDGIKAAAKGFEKKYNCKITWDSYTDYSKIQTMVNNDNVTWDVATLDSYWTYAGAKYLEDIDYDIVDKTGIEDYTSKKGVGAYTFATVIAYNTSKYNSQTSPQTWADFFNTDKYPGKRTFYKNPIHLFEEALLADGVAPEDLYPIDIDRALNKLDTVKDSVSVWWESGSEPAQLLSSNEVDLASAWSGRIQDAKDEGEAVDYNYNQALCITDNWGIIKGTKHKKLANEFINYVTRPKAQARFAKTVSYGPVNQGAYQYLDDATIRKIPSSDYYKDQVVWFNPEWWAKNYDKANEKFQNWLLED
ncbi:MAG: polyamine ABC transporter substrate-binding protein [Absicoccus sp.]|uniref:polyamine ABC transporter substrate-binding protein n=1 Tax=Absicoccus sp. TaxID=2718527 RepID=UPI002A75C4D6|nr:polyamine ABC transporter substrate-binding protein [Absicoccus sp.]MDY3035458.1 polyamine ABC transporter substrate-binding protein [Absicoccus sp.]